MSPAAKLTPLWVGLGLLLNLNAAEAAVDFDRDIRPLLSDRCFKCHGPDTKQRKAKLRLDTKAGLFGHGQQSGPPPVRAGAPDTSELFQRISSTDPDEVMPPPASKLGLSQSEINLLRKWIEEGAQYSKHWAFSPPAVPTHLLTGTRHPIDEIVAAGLVKLGMTNAPPASREQLIRRLSFDLTGLPPTIAEIDAFLADQRPGAYQTLAIRLIESERFGERMASYWLDLARYADTSGYLYDWPRTMWPWRDWVIRAFNDNLPFNQFIQWQIAGDLIPNASADQIIATAFNRNHGYTIENGIIGEEYRTAYVADRVTTMGTAFLGLTLECARCHDHKYDPITQQEFYQLFAFFNQVPEVGVQPNRATFASPSVGVPLPEQLAAVQQTEQEIARLSAQMLRYDPAAEAQQSEWEKQINSIWTILRPRNAKSRNGATVKLQPDHSILISGANPATDQQVIHLHQEMPGDVTAIRLEALGHPSLVNGGPGRSASGNALMTFMSVTRIRPDGFRETIPLERATADREDQAFGVAGAIDSAPRTGWAAPSNNGRSPCSAVFEFSRKQTFDPEDIVEVQLTYGAPFPQHVFGRVRFALTTNSSPNRLDPTGRVADLAKLRAADRTPRESSIIRNYVRAAHAPQYKKLNRQIAALEKRRSDQRAAIPSLMIMQDQVARSTHVLERGRYDRPLELVQPDTPAIFPPFPADAPRNRLGLARWLTQPDHPLVARVIVNQVWQLLFGQGLVRTADDFGVQGDRPVYPELLDWLATDFIRNGWNLKRLILVMVTSETYQRSSRTTPTQLRLDPDNRQLARGSRFRLPAEMIRDGALLTGGLLAERVGGPSVRPYQPAGLWERLTKHPDFQQRYEQSHGDELYRRSLYTYWKRSSLHPAMAAFDAPRRQVCTVNRRPTNTPQQALVLLHDPQFIEAARGLATRMLTDTTFGNTISDRIAVAFRTVTSRQPEPAEVDSLGHLHTLELQKFASDPASVTALLGIGESELPKVLPPERLAAATMVMRAILNLNEAISRP